MVLKIYQKFLVLIVGFLLYGNIVHAQTDSLYTKKEVIYDRKDGMALTMFVLTPKAKIINRGIVNIASGGYYSTVNWLGDMTKRSEEFLRRGYTVFIVFHGSAPMYAANEAVGDVQHAVQFIRYHAKDYNISPDKIGASGSSAGGNLSLLIGTTDAKDEKSTNPVERVSSRVQAVACFMPPTDFLNYGKDNNNPMDDKVFYEEKIVKGNLKSAFSFKELNPATNTYELITNHDKIVAILKQMSPRQQADKNAASVLLYHGDNDDLVPIQQSVSFVDKLKSLNIPAKLVVKKGAGHGWENQTGDMPVLADWFDVYLK
ncbi:prolyl oligopeptidase family serine peptidase [Flavobacterium sp. 3HN19-14]|uniref:prolyl oligopeptidase family serine peptidase n=1 Tax=Flavobacterium sp. 3HN19-14 TaxID=3448133 RepID=UPI003EDEDF6F